MTRSGRPSSGSGDWAGWKIAGSTVFEMTTGSRSSMPSSACFARLYRDCSTVASASSALIDWIRRSVPSSKPRYAPIGPSTRWTILHSPRAKRRSRAKSKLNELNRHACVPPEMRSCSTARPRPCSSPTSARRNWCPPPAGAGSKSWNTAMSADPRREPSHSASARTRRTAGRPARRTSRGAARTSTGDTVTSTTDALALGA